MTLSGLTFLLSKTPSDLTFVGLPPRDKTPWGILFFYFYFLISKTLESSSLFFLT
jgi:hypothetical protein